jgi:hypothetical protein
VSRALRRWQGCAAWRNCVRFADAPQPGREADVRPDHVGAVATAGDLQVATAKKPDEARPEPVRA